MRKTLIIGACSAIAEATARRMAAEGGALYLVARNRDRLDAVAADLEVRGAAKVDTCVMERYHYEQHPQLLQEVMESLGGLDALLIAYGTLPDQKACEEAFELTRQAQEINYLSVLSFLHPFADCFEKQGRGTIAVISSVAGDRGRQSNYVYGAAKGALSLYLQGLRNRLSRSGVQVLTIKPGFVDTPMTREFKKGLLWAAPESVAKDIHAAIKTNRDILYTPWFWRYIMFVIRMIPERLFKKMQL